MNNVRNIVFASLLVAGTASGGAASAAPEGKRLILLTGPTQDRLINGFATDFRTTAEKAGMKVTLLTSPFDPALQAQQIDDAVGQKPDMIIVHPLSSRCTASAASPADYSSTEIDDSSVAA
jgi:ribose transport system substrate-binding protein